MNAWNAEKPYNHLPDLPPITDLESKEILKKCIVARAALAGLKQAAERIPNQNMLINTLPVMEAQASSEIENIVTTADQLFQSLQLENTTDPAVKEALQYRTALFAGVASLARLPVCTQTAVLVCSEIKGRPMDIRKVSGIALRGSASGQVIYTPPDGEDLIRGKLANWERFIHETPEIDTLVIMAVAHYQFEAIHPFLDGNGRTGRVLNSLLLIENGLLGQPILYLSRYIIRTKADYYRLLLDVTAKGAWQEWILYILEGIRETAEWTLDKIEAITNLATHTRDYIRDRAPHIYTHELIDLLFSQPYIRIANLEMANIAKRQTASKYLRELCEMGVLAESVIGRDKLFVHPKLMALLQDENHSFSLYF